FLAIGEGWLSWVVPENRRGQPTEGRGPGGQRASAEPAAAQRFEARWTKQLHARPHEGQQVISLEGQAVSQMAGMGRLAAEEVHVWLREDLVPREQAADQGLPGQGMAGAMGRSNSKLRPKLTPQRMMARGQVDVRSTQLTGRTEKLEAWFVEASPRVSLR